MDSSLQAKKPNVRKQLWETMDVTTTANPSSTFETVSENIRGAILFDLDGTLVDPAGGITSGIAHALRTMDLHVPAEDVLSAMIGPKLADGMNSILGVPLALVPAVIKEYRQWYATRGMGMSVVYPGLMELLAQLRKAGFLLAVATQKPEPLAQKLLAHHGLTRFFQVIHGSSADETLLPGDPGYRADKAAIIAAALLALDAGPAGARPALMVGDRHQDVRGAHSNSLDCIGVSWGFAAVGELEAAGVAAVAQDAAQLSELLVKHFPLYPAASKEAGHGGPS